MLKEKLLYAVAVSIVPVICAISAVRLSQAGGQSEAVAATATGKAAGTSVASAVKAAGSETSTEALGSISPEEMKELFLLERAYWNTHSKALARRAEAKDLEAEAQQRFNALQGLLGKLYLKYEAKGYLLSDDGVLVKKAKQEQAEAVKPGEMKK